MNQIIKPQEAKQIDTRQQIIDVAKNIILGKGFAAVGLNEILTCANVPKGSFYHYFASKEAFGCAMLTDYFDDYTQKIASDLQDSALPPAQRLHNYFRHWLETQSSDITQEKCLVVKLSAEVTDLSEAMRITLQAGTQQVIDILQACIQQGMDAGDFMQTESAETTAKQLYYMWLGATLITKVQHTRDALECAMQATEKRLNIQIAAVQAR
jgi:TetR/AcrR family transcriptional regulator, transcriptional repressor for nem operon